MEFGEKTISRRYVYKGKILNLRSDEAELVNGKRVVREVVEHSGGVCVAALTAGGELVFVRQYRYPYGKEILELPAGKIEKGEDPLCCGKRELAEETGFQADTFVPMGEFYPSCGYTDEVIYLFLAHGLHAFEQHLDDDEFLRVEMIPLQEAVRQIQENQLPDGKTQALVLRAYLWSLRERKEE